MLSMQDESGDERTTSARHITVDEDLAGQRIDSFLAVQLSQHSRTQVRKAINAKLVTVNGQQVKGLRGLKSLVKDIQFGAPTVFHIERGGELRYLIMQVE